MYLKPTKDDLQVISSIAVFHGLKTEVVESLVRPASTMILKRHERVIHQGDTATSLFIVIDGWVKLYRSNVAGEESVIEIMTRGGSFGEADALTGKPHFFSVEAVSDARLSRIPADHVAASIRDKPDIALAMIASISQHVHYLVQQVAQLKAQSAVQRLAEFLVSLSPAPRGSCTFKLPYDKILIAAWLGLTPESLSRAFARLRSIGVCVDATQVSVSDIDKLRQLAEDDRGTVRDVLRTT
jgi:CRP-like cAMP-binding protein